MEGKMLEYQEQNKIGKTQIIKFIRKMYNGTPFRDIYSGLHKAILKDDRLIGVATDIGMIKEQYQNK